MEQGQVGDCWLLASLSALAASASAPRLLARLFPTADAVAGSVTVSLYAHGAWTDVTVDTLVPCDAECQPLFARGSAAAALVEKAYAKLRGSYAALDEGRASEACVDLTGGVAERVSVEEHGAALYARMMRWQHAGRPMTATRLPHLRPAGAAAPSVGDDYRAEPHHAYAVAAVGGGGGHGGHAVLLRDPRGRDEWVAFATFAASFEVVTVCTVFDGPPLLVADVGVDALGGPPAAPRWACNAQWVLRAPRRATVTVALAQRERAAARQQPLTLIVVRLDGGATRAWRCDAPAIETRAGGELGVAQREVHASFVAAAGQAYAVVPSLRSPAGAAGGGALLLRVWCDAPACVVEATPPLRRFAVDGVWGGDGGGGAGGRWPLASWGSNPQVAVCCAAPRATALVLLERTDEPTAAPCAFSAARAVGLCAVRPAAEPADREGGAAVAVLSGISGNARSPGAARLLAGGDAQLASDSDVDARLKELRRPRAAAARAAAARSATRRSAPPHAGAAAAACGAPSAAEAVAGVGRALRCAPDHVVLEAGYENEDEAHALVALRGGAPLLLVPSTAAAAERGAFALTLYSDAPLELRTLPPAHCACARGAWRGGGGSHLEAGWGANPQYALRLRGGGAGGDDGEPLMLRLLLARPEREWAPALKRSVVDAMAGVYIFRADRGDGRLALGEKDAAPLVHETPFSPLCELTCALRLPLAESEQLVVMPATWGAAQCGPFELAAYGDRPFELVEI